MPGDCAAYEGGDDNSRRHLGAHTARPLPCAKSDRQLQCPERVAGIATKWRSRYHMDEIKLGRWV
jgi:hypothetical protein